MPDAIEIRGLQKVIDQNLAVDIAALTVQAGEIAAIVGPPGSGKATLLQLLTGRIRPTAGTLCVLGLSPSAEKEKLSRALGVLFAHTIPVPGYDLGTLRTSAILRILR